MTDVSKNKATFTCGFVYYFLYFFPLFPAFFASNSAFAARRAGDLYGRLEVFFFGLSAIILVMTTCIY